MVKKSKFRVGMIVRRVRQTTHRANYTTVPIGSVGIVLEEVDVDGDVSVKFFDAGVGANGQWGCVHQSLEIVPKIEATLHVLAR